MSKREMIITIVASIIGSGIFNVLLTSYLYERQLEEERKNEYEKKLGEKIFEALSAVRDLELKCHEIDIYDIENELNNPLFDSFGDLGTCLTITNNQNNWFEFCKQVTNARRKYERYLGFDEAAYLYYMERYCQNFTQFIGTYQIDLNYAGAILASDFQKWQKEYEKMLVDKINNPEYKIYDKNGEKWEDAKKNVMDKLWKNALLQKVKEDDGSLEAEMVKALLIEKDEEKAMELISVTKQESEI